MTLFTQAALVVVLAHAAAVAFFPALTLPHRSRLLVVALVAGALLPLPLVIAPDHRLLRAILAIVCATTVVRVYDVHVGALRGIRPSARSFVAFILNPFCLVQRKLGDEPVPSRRDSMHRLVRGLCSGGAGYLLLRSVSDSAESGTWPFLAEHAAKAVLCFVVVYGISEVAVALWRLCGLRGRHMMDNFFFARTPAEFWRLYNRPAGQFLLEDVSRQSPLRRAPVMATLIAFAVNGLIHEYIATIAIGRVQGFQLAFFTLQGAAVALTQPMKPRGAVAVPWMISTFIFNLATCMLFFASGDQLVDWYSDAVRGWMRR